MNAMIINWSFIVSQLANKNVQEVQFLIDSTVDNDMGPIACSFANQIGGVIIIGVDPINCHVRGTTITKQWIEDYFEKTIQPRIEFAYTDVFKHDIRLSVIQLFMGTEKPYAFEKNRYLIQDKKPTALPNQANGQGLLFRQQQVAAFLDHYQNITNRQYRKLCQVSHKTAHYELIALVKSGMLVCQGMGRATHYIKA